MWISAGIGRRHIILSNDSTTFKWNSLPLIRDTIRLLYISRSLHDHWNTYVPYDMFIFLYVTYLSSSSFNWWYIYIMWQQKWFWSITTVESKKDSHGIIIVGFFYFVYINIIHYCNYGIMRQQNIWVDVLYWNHFCTCGEIHQEGKINPLYNVDHR